MVGYDKCMILSALVLAIAAGVSLPLAWDAPDCGAGSQMQPDAECARGSSRVMAARLLMPTNQQGLPQSAAWESAQPVVFCSDWQGQPADPQRETEVRLLWSREFLFLRFRAHYREIYVFPEANTRRDQLWLRDVAEVFIQPDTDGPRHYREFEISPNGNWLDLDINEGRKSDLLCDLRRKVTVDVLARVWVAELAIPMSCLTGRFHPEATWRINFFRVEGPEPTRFYSTWRPTHTPRPNFHVPEVFGELRFSSK